MLDQDRLEQSIPGDIVRTESEGKVSLMATCIKLLKEDLSGKTERLQREQEVNFKNEINEGREVFLVVRRGEYPPENGKAVLLLLSGNEGKLQVDYLVVDAGFALNPENVASLQEEHLTRKVAEGQFSLSKDLNGYFPVGYRDTKSEPFLNRLRPSGSGRFGRKCDLEIRGIDSQTAKDIFSDNYDDDVILAVFSLSLKGAKEKDESGVLPFPSRVEQRVAA